MSDKAGVWIDHRKAVVVTVSPDGEHTTTLIASSVEKHPERGGDSPLKGSYESRQVPADDSHQRALTGEPQHLLRCRHCSPSRSPEAAPPRSGRGQGRTPLHKRLVKMQLGARVVAVQTEDKMTDGQLVAKVRAYFGLSAPRAQ